MTVSEGFGSAGAGAQPGIPGMVVSVPQFPITSRYYGLEVAHLARSEGGAVVYLRRRLIPPPEHFELLHTYAVVERDRIDNISAQQLGDPSQYWRLCDANAVMMPEELERVGRSIRITMPEGIPGPAGV